MPSQGVLGVENRYVKEAIGQIERDKNVPNKRRSRGYCLKVDSEHHYPPKYVLSRAHHYKTGKERRHFKGGPQTNTVLKKLGYTVEPCARIPDCQSRILA